MKNPLIAFLFLAACDGEQDANRQAARGPGAAGGTAQPPRLETLTGLYEGGGPGRLNQLCITGDRFGLVIWGANDHSCSGSGTVTRQGEGRLRFAMAGDSQCAIEAVISGKTVVFPQAAPDGCAYYCGARAQLGGASLSQRGTGPSDALKAKDLVGEPLCGPEGE